MLLVYSEYRIMIPGSRHAIRTYKRAREFAVQYERWFMPAMLVAGTAFDVWQFKVLDLREKFILMCVYVAVVMGSMISATYKQSEASSRLRYIRLVAPFAQQFAMGGLLSTALLFYWFSGDVAVTWPIVTLVAFLMISNETLRHIVLRPLVQVGILSFALFSLCAIWFAHLFHSLSWPVFLAGGFTSMVVMTGLLTLLIRLGDLYKDRMRMWTVMAGVFAFMNVCYFFNIIPPIPLALRDATMAYSIADDFTLSAPEESWLDQLIPGQEILLTPGNALYAYTAIYAPEDVSAIIVHVWERYDEDQKNWVAEHRLTFTIIGGRSDGYRGYSMVSSLAAGKWRVSVETVSGQVLGRIGFSIVTGR